MADLTSGEKDWRFLANFRKKARDLADARNLAALANDTKWGEFFAEIKRLGIPLQVKVLYEDNAYATAWVWMPHPKYLDSSHGPNLFVFIEWIRTSEVEDVARIAKTVGLEYSISGAEVTVYGYK
jgi:hypothetical protein